MALLMSERGIKEDGASSPHTWVALQERRLEKGGDNIERSTPKNETYLQIYDRNVPILGDGAWPACRLRQTEPALARRLHAQYRQRGKTAPSCIRA